MKGLRDAFLLAAALATAFGGGYALAAAVGIVQQERSFHPNEVTIAAGDTLNFDNQDEFIHQIYVASDQMTFDSAEQPPGQVVSISFPKSGDFNVRCHIHPKMLLVVHVK